MQPIGRYSYLFCGSLLVVFKVALDTFVSRLFGKAWTAFLYWSPVQYQLFSMPDADRNYALTLAAVALPFTVAGIWLTARRLKTLGLALWLSVLFFLPVINLIFFLYLVAAPESDADTAGLPNFFSQDSKTALFASAGVAATSALIGVAVSIAAFTSYGWGVFFAVPFLIGVLTTLLTSIPVERSFAFHAGATMLSLGLTGLGLLLFAFEGLVCLLMCIPLAIPVSLVGVWVGREIVSPGSRRLPSQAAIITVLLSTVGPISAGNDGAFQQALPPTPVITSVEINAPPSVVWPLVIAFPKLQRPSELLFRAGIAYPISARIEGTGPGAIRYCEFSTGPFVEPITAWKHGELLAFDVTSSPAPMREFSPFNIHPPHLDGFLQSRRGQFRLIAMDQGRRTRLEGTTWYQQSLYPQTYWQLWTDAIIHKIHFRVLDHIRVLAESKP